MNTSPWGTRDANGRPTLSLYTRLSILLFGIVLPLVTIVVESTTHMCAKELFDPLPSAVHLILALSVPILFIITYAALSSAERVRPWHGPVVGFALGIAMVFAIPFAPLLPLSLLAVAFMGLGFLPLAPILALQAGLLARRAFRSLAKAGGDRPPVLWKGMLVGILLMALPDVPLAVTRIALSRAVSKDEEVRPSGLWWLRHVGARNEILRYCYQQSGMALNLFSPWWWGEERITVEEARRVFYQVTGVPFNTVPPPPSARERARSEFDFGGDREQGGEAVGAPAVGLSLASSRLDGSIDADAALAYTEWTLELRNDSPTPREARAQMALPPGGVVSRVTLWVNGEEREAAFGPRGKVRQAYQAVVQQRRDPLLVTTVGPDRVLVQCFPVPPSGGFMKIRVGITAPLVLETRERGWFSLPHLVEWNFARPKSVRHAVWLESKHELRATDAALQVEPLAGGGAAVRGSLPEQGQGAIAVSVERDPKIATSWTRDRRGAQEENLVQSIDEAAPARPSEVFLVVDASAGMRPFAAELVESLGRMPQGLPVHVVLATDEPAPAAASAAEALRHVTWSGGRDNVPALTRAWDEASRRPGAILVWVHAPQPVLIETAVPLRQRWERRPDGPALIDVPVSRGPNRILETLDGLPAIGGLPRRGRLQLDLEDLFSSWQKPAPRLVRTWHRVSTSSRLPDASHETSDHLARLWAHGEIARRAEAPSSCDEAVDLAVRYQLVTPVSGAVVLQTLAEHAAADLDPAAPKDVPTVPEPGEWAVLIVLSVMVAFALGRRTWEAGPCPAR